MKTLLTINHQKFVLPNGANVAAAVKALSGAVAVQWDYDSHKSGEEDTFFVEKPIELSIKQVPDSCFKLRPGEVAPAEFNARKLRGGRQPLLLKDGGRR